MKGRRVLLTACLAAALAVVPSVACAAGTGDSAVPTEDVPTKATIAAELDYTRWLEGGPMPGRVSPLGSDIPYKYYYTPTHAQERAYWCGPATVQIIDDYWGTPATQSQIAAWLGTTTAGTDFSRVDDAITHFAGVGYVYSGPCTSEVDVANRIQYGLLSRKHPMAADVRIDGSVWSNYRYDHLGHILCVEGFDWRSMTVRLNDPFSERYWQPDGGDTLGHKTYPRKQVTQGVLSHWRRAMVY